jgi:hypothetical protein
MCWKFIAIITVNNLSFFITIESALVFLDLNSSVSVDFQN